jgi:competence protein ComEC
MSYRLLFKIILLLVLSILNFSIWVNVLKLESSSDLKVVFLDVGQGDAIFIETKKGKQVLIDGGPNDKVISELSKHMALSDKKIDLIIATHPDSDHIGGLNSVLRRYDYDFFMEPGSVSNTMVYKDLKNVVNSSKAKKIIAKRGMVIDLGDSVYLRVLFPDRDVSRLETNTSSIILSLINNKNSFVLTGDSPISVEEYVISLDKDWLEADVLKVGHHGSRTSTSEKFLEQVSPQMSVISAGLNNKYGHPHQEVLDKLTKAKSLILQTSKSGSIVMFSDGESIRVK